MSICASAGTASAIAAKGIIRQYFFEDAKRPRDMMHVRTLLIRFPSALRDINATSSWSLAEHNVKEDTTLTIDQ
jgi:hypothetical protein